MAAVTQEREWSIAQRRREMIEKSFQDWLRSDVSRELNGVFDAIERMLDANGGGGPLTEEEKSELRKKFPETVDRDGFDKTYQREVANKAAAEWDGNPDIQKLCNKAAWVSDAVRESARGGVNQRRNQVANKSPHKSEGTETRAHAIARLAKEFNDNAETFKRMGMIRRDYVHGSLLAEGRPGVFEEEALLLRD